jgi:hypothetical protein
MEKLLGTIGTIPGALPGDLTAIGGAKLIRAEGCVFLDLLYKCRGNAKLDAFPDKTGYECFVNHIHLDDYSDDIAGQLKLALGLMQRIKQNFRRSEYSQLPIEFIVSVNESSCVLRFHILREGQDYLDNDLSTYKLDAIAISSLSEDIRFVSE